MDTKVMQKISYGLYVLTSAVGGQSNGCIINTLNQLTSNPLRISVTVNKSNYTHYVIKNSGSFNVSIIDESADFSLFKQFGFSSGRDNNKLFKQAYKTSESGLPYVINGTSSYISCKVINSIDLGTHTMFIADVIEGEMLSDKPPMTYAFYHANVKPKPVAKKTDDNTERWVCNICGYIHEGKLPNDFICPICKHGASDFSLMK